MRQRSNSSTLSNQYGRQNRRALHRTRSVGSITDFGSNSFNLEQGPDLEADHGGPGSILTRFASQASSDPEPMDEYDVGLLGDSALSSSPLGATPRPDPPPDQVPQGLANGGTDCFMNAAVQLLAGSYADLFDPGQNELGDENEDAAERAVQAAVWQAIRHVNEHVGEVGQLRTTLEAHRLVNTMDDQEDAAELVRKLLELVIDGRLPNREPVGRGQAANDYRVITAWTRTLGDTVDTDAVGPDPEEYNEHGSVDQRLEANTLMVEAPEHRSIQEYLNAVTGGVTTVVEDATALKNGTPVRYNSYTDVSRFDSVPPVLTFVVRWSGQGDIFDHTEAEIAFANHRYLLASVVRRTGGVNEEAGGHYFADRRTGAGWHRCNDTNVTELKGPFSGGGERVHMATYNFAGPVHEVAMQEPLEGQTIDPEVSEVSDDGGPELTLPPASQGTGEPLRPRIGVDQRRHHRQSRIQEDYTKDVQQRAAELEERLRGDRKDSVNRVAMLLATDLALDLSDAYARLTGHDLHQDVARAFPRSADQVYLLSLLVEPYGEPSLEARLLLATGLAAPTLPGDAARPSDRAEAIDLLEKASVSERAELASKQTWPRIVQQIGTRAPSPLGQRERAYGAYATALVSGAQAELSYAAVEEQDVPWHVSASRHVELEQAKVEEAKRLFKLLMLPRAFAHPGDALTRQKAVTRILGWAEDQRPEVREYVASSLHDWLAKHLSKRNVTYVCGLLRMESLAPPDGQSPEDTARAQQVEELGLYMERKQDKGKQGINKDRTGITTKKRLNSTFSSLTDKIELLDAKGKLALLKEQTGIDPTSDRERERAIEVFTKQLADLGVKKDKRQRIAKGLRLAAPTQVSRKGALHNKIERRLARGQRQKVIRAIRDLEREELALLVSDTGLLLKIRQACRTAMGQEQGEDYGLSASFPVAFDPEAQWAYVADLLGIDVQHMRPFHHEEGESDEQMKERIADEVQLRPEYWARRIQGHFELSPSDKWDRTRLYVVLNDCYRTARRVAAQPTMGEPTTPQEFMNAVRERVVDLSPIAAGMLDSDKFSEVDTALTEGRPVSDEAWMHDAKFTGARQIRRIRANLLHTNMRPSDVIAALDATSGTQLLDEWSNIEEYREIRRRMLYASDEGEREKLQGLMSVFIPHLRYDKYNKLKSAMSTSSFEEVLLHASERFAEAMGADEEFRLAVSAEGLGTESLDVARIRGEVALHRARGDRHGLQHKGLSTKSRQEHQGRRTVARDMHATRRMLIEGQRDQITPQEVGRLTRDTAELERQADAFGDMRARMQQHTMTVMGMVMGAAASLITMGTASPVFAALGTTGATFAQAFIGTAAASTVKQAVAWAFEGHMHNHWDGFYTILKDLLLTTATVGSGLTSTELATAYGWPSELQSAFVQGLRDNALSVSPVEVTFRQLTEAGVDRAMEVEKGDRLKLTGRAFVKGVAIDALLKTWSFAFESDVVQLESTDLVQEFGRADLGQLSYDEVLLRVANEISTQQTESVNEGEGWSALILSRIEQELDRVGAKTKIVNEEPGPVGGSLSELAEGDATIQDALARGYTDRDLKLVFDAQTLFQEFRVHYPFRELGFCAIELCAFASAKDLCRLGYPLDEIARCGYPVEDLPLSRRSARKARKQADVYVCAGYSEDSIAARLHALHPEPSTA